MRRGRLLKINVLREVMKMDGMSDSYELNKVKARVGLIFFMMWRNIWLTRTKVVAIRLPYVHFLNPPEPKIPT